MRVCTSFPSRGSPLALALGSVALALCLYFSLLPASAAVLRSSAKPAEQPTGRLLQLCVPLQLLLLLQTISRRCYRQQHHQGRKQRSLNDTVVEL